MIAGPSVRRATSLLAVASLFVGLLRAFANAGQGRLTVTVVLAVCLGGVLVLAVLVATTSDDRRLGHYDIAALVLGITILLSQFSGVTDPELGSGGDEHLLDQLATRTLLAGHDPYSHVYRLVGADGFGTPLLGGGQANTYGYPPLLIEIARVLGFVSHRLADPAVVDAGALTALAILTFLAVPRALRPLAITLVLGFGLLTETALAGTPVVLAVALLCVPLRSWTSTGAGGRLGRRGVTQAVFLGLAAAAQQLSWFVAVFLVVGLVLVRRGEVGGRRALGVVLRDVAIAVAVFVALNAPFIAVDASSWWRGMTVTFTERAIVFGSGPALPLIEAHGGTARLSLLWLAPELLLAGLLVVFAVGFRRLAPALLVLPACAFYLSARSNSEYFYSFVPLWLVSVTTIDTAAVAASRPLAARVLRTPRRRWMLASAALVPSLVVFGLGVMGTPPVGLQPTRVVVDGARIVSISLVVTNRTSTPIDPQYFVDGRTAITHPWVAESGPRVLAPDRRTDVTIVPRTSLESDAIAAKLWIFATTDAPAGMAARPMTFAASQIDVRGLAGATGLEREKRECLALTLTGRRYDCATQLGLAVVRHVLRRERPFRATPPEVRTRSARPG